MDILEENLFKNGESKEKADVETEVLFKNASAENLAYEEPSDNKSGFDVLFNDVPSLKEESLAAEIHKSENKDSDVASEVLFKSGVEDIDVGENVKISEESIDFKEPEKPALVSEEVLFGKESEELRPFNDDEHIIGDSVLNETSFTSDTPIVKDGDYSYAEKEEDDDGAYQLTFGDIGDAINEIPDETYAPAYRKRSFAEKTLDAEPEIIEKYQELKNILISYKGVKSRVSNVYDTFNKGRLVLAKMAVTGKSLKLYLNLDYDKVETRLKCKYAGDKKVYEKVPVFLRIRSPRSFRNAKYLIIQLAEYHGLTERKNQKTVDAVEILREKMD